MLRNVDNKWTMINHDEIRDNLTWLRNKKEPYLLFLKKCENNNQKGMAYEDPVYTTGKISYYVTRHEGLTP